jgi:hypothetical protein
MRTALDAAPSMLDEHERKFVANIRDHGWFHTSVHQDETGPGFSYTTGFWLNMDFPELITFSLSQEVAHDTFWHIYRELKAGQSFVIRQPVENVFAGLKGAFLPVLQRHFKDHLGWSRWFYGGDDFKCVQLVWTDRHGKFPWQPGHSVSLAEAQPDLTEGSWSGLQYH